MAFYTDDELAALFSDGESQAVERKRNAADGTALRRTVCAFANDLPGAGRPGVIFIGVEDDGSCAGLEIDDALLARLAQIRSDGSIQPLPSIAVGKQTIAGCEVAAVQAAPALHPPVRYRGRVWVRVGPTVQQSTAEEERRLGERRQAADRPFDMRPARGAALDALDMEHIRAQYLPLAVAEDVLERNERPLDR